MIVHLKGSAIHLRSLPDARLIQNIMMVTKTATRPKIASFDQVSLVADGSLIVEDTGSAAA